MDQPRWFVAVLVFQSRVGPWDDDPLVDHQVRLLQAPDAEAAYESALHLGRGEKTTYANADGEQVSWAFLGLSELDELGPASPSHGDEIFSWITHGPGAEFVVDKHRLSVFAHAADAHKTAREILDE